MWGQKGLTEEGGGMSWCVYIAIGKKCMGYTPYSKGREKQPVMIGGSTSVQHVYASEYCKTERRTASNSTAYLLGLQGDDLEHVQHLAVEGRHHELARLGARPVSSAAGGHPKDLPTSCAQIAQRLRNNVSTYMGKSDVQEWISTLRPH